MARTASGNEVLDQAKQFLTQARTVEELRQAQAVVLPLEFGLSLQQTADAMGVSVSWACQLRRRFVTDGAQLMRPSRGGRRRQNMSHEEETTFLMPYMEQMKNGGTISVNDVKQTLDKKLGRDIPLGSVYNLLHRHGWHKRTTRK